MEYSDLLDWLDESCHALALWDIIRSVYENLNNEPERPLSVQTIEEVLVCVEELLESGLFYIGTKDIINEKHVFHRIALPVADILTLIRKEFDADEHMPAKTGFKYYFQPSSDGKKLLEELANSG